MWRKTKRKTRNILWSDGKDDSKTVAEGDHEDESQKATRNNKQMTGKGGRSRNFVL